MMTETAGCTSALGDSQAGDTRNLMAGPVARAPGDRIRTAVAMGKAPLRQRLPDQRAELGPAIAVFPTELGEALGKSALLHRGPHTGIMPLVKGEILCFVASWMIISKRHPAVHIVLRP